LEFNDDDVNCLALSPDDQFLASADDTGEIKLIQLRPQIKVHRTLRKHTTICSSVLFRPRRPTSILSSGLDSVIVVWEDFTRCRVGQVVKMADVVKVAAANKREMGGEAEPEPPSSYMVNPPLVHCVAASPDGSWLVAGVEDSSIQLFDTSKKTVIYVTSTPSKIHTKGVSQVAFIAADKFISGGNDGQIVLWQLLQTTTTTTLDANENAVASESGASGVKGKRQKSGKNKTTAGKSQPPQPKITTETVIQPLQRIPHELPINWLSVVNVKDASGESGEVGANAETDAVGGATNDCRESGKNVGKAADDGDKGSVNHIDSVAAEIQTEKTPSSIVVAVADSSSDVVLYALRV